MQIRIFRRAAEHNQWRFRFDSEKHCLAGQTGWRDFVNLHAKHTRCRPVGKRGRAGEQIDRLREEGRGLGPDRSDFAGHARWIRGRLPVVNGDIHGQMSAIIAVADPPCGRSGIADTDLVRFLAIRAEAEIFHDVIRRARRVRRKPACVDRIVEFHNRPARNRKLNHVPSLIDASGGEKTLRRRIDIHLVLAVKPVAEIFVRIQCGRRLIAFGGKRAFRISENCIDSGKFRRIPPSSPTVGIHKMSIAGRRHIEVPRNERLRHFHRP